MTCAVKTISKPTCTAIFRRKCGFGRTIRCERFAQWPVTAELNEVESLPPGAVLRSIVRKVQSHVQIPKEALRARLGVMRDTDQASLVLVDDLMRTRALFGMTVDGSPTLSFYDRESNRRVMLQTFGDGSTALDLFDRDQRIRASLGTAELTLDTTGATEKTSPSTLVLFDHDGKVITRLPQE